MTPKRYPDQQVIRQFIVLKGMIAQARWQKTINLITTAVIFTLVLLAIWFFWPQISVVLNQLSALRDQINNIP